MHLKVMLSAFSICVYAVTAYTYTYNDINENLNVEELVRNKTELMKYVDCFLERAPCTPQTTAYKGHLTEIVDDGCKECDGRAKHMFRVFVQGVKNVLPEDYVKFKARYDKNNHFDTTMAEVKNA